MAWLEIIFHLNGYARAPNSLSLDPFYSHLLIPKEKKNIWSELESNPGPLASCSQATALTTRQWLLAHKWQLLNSDACNQKPPKWSRNSSWCVRCLPDENYLMEKKFNIQQSFFFFRSKVINLHQPADFNYKIGPDPVEEERRFPGLEGEWQFLKVLDNFSRGKFGWTQWKWKKRGVFEALIN